VIARRCVHTHNMQCIAASRKSMNSDLALCRAWLSICWEARQSIQCYSSAALGSGRRAVVLSLLDWSRTRALQHDDTHTRSTSGRHKRVPFPATGSFCSSRVRKCAYISLPARPRIMYHNHDHIPSRSGSLAQKEASLCRSGPFFGPE
jgi:hypothetical protein